MKITIENCAQVYEHIATTYSESNLLIQKQKDKQMGMYMYIKAFTDILYANLRIQ